MDWIWLGVIISLLLIELVSLNLTAIWFVVSSIISYILLKCEQDYIIQVVCFLIVGALLIVIIRPRIIKKWISLRDNLIDKITSKHPFFSHFVPAEIRIEKKLLEEKNDNKNILVVTNSLYEANDKKNSSNNSKNKNNKNNNSKNKNDKSKNNNKKSSKKK